MPDDLVSFHPIVNDGLKIDDKNEKSDSENGCENGRHFRHEIGCLKLSRYLGDPSLLQLFIFRKAKYQSLPFGIDFAFFTLLFYRIITSTTEGYDALLTHCGLTNDIDLKVLLHLMKFTWTSNFTAKHV